MKNYSLFIILIFWFLGMLIWLLMSSMTLASSSQTSNINSITTIVNDMKLPHEGTPHGVPLDWDWAQKPRINWGNDPKGFTGFQSWGQVYEDTYGNKAKNSRVQIKNLKAYILSKKENTWHLVQQSVTVEGKEFAEDFINDENHQANFKIESDHSVSIKTGNGYNFHFWIPSKKLNIDPNDIGGVYITVDARLIIENPKLPDDRIDARYILSVGADYWRDVNSEWAGPNINNGDVGIGRFKYVTSDWKAFNMISLSEIEVYQNPPPLE